MFRLRLFASALIALLVSLLGAQGAVSSHVATIPIGEVQGAVADTDDGTLHRSPFAPASGNGNGSTVAVRGLITQKVVQRASNGTSNFAFFLQDTAATRDSDPNTSDGIFVFHGRFTTLLRETTGSYTPQVGDEVVLRGPVNEFFNVTQLNNPRLIHVERTGVDVATETAPFEVAPPDDLAAANRYWERHEGMRGRIPSGAVVLNGLNVFPSTADGELWLARGDSAIAERTGYARRSFRDPHPLDDQPALFDNGNGYRILIGSHGVKTAADNTILLAPGRTFDTVTNDLVGGLYFAFSKYQFQPEQQPQLVHGPDPSLNSPPLAFDRTREYSVSDFNVENLYDFRDDPFDGCDFTGNAGCPGVNPPFDYVPTSDAVYRERLGQLAEQIRVDLHGPDIVLVQEAEDQDICTPSGNALSCGSTNNADGKADTLQDLALAIRAQGGPAYEVAYDRDGADDRGIVAAFMYRTDRVQLRPVTAADPIFGNAPQVSYRGTALPYNTDVQNPKVLNAVLPADVDRSTTTDGNNVYTRAPQIGSFRIWRDGIGTSVFTDIYALSNHFSSTPDRRVGQRREQSLYNAAIVDVLRDSESRVLTGGDFNVFPRPDDPFAPGHPLSPSDQLGPLYDEGLSNLWNYTAAHTPAGAYSYVFVGQAQTLDHQFVTPALEDELQDARGAHINADWPNDYFADGARGTSDHDPLVSRFVDLPTIERLRDLVGYYVDTAQVRDKTGEQLLDRLARAERFAADGMTDAYLSQLQAFADQARDLAPQHITTTAAGALAHEAELLKNS